MGCTKDLIGSQTNLRMHRAKTVTETLFIPSKSLPVRLFHHLFVFFRHSIPWNVDGDIFLILNEDKALLLRDIPGLYVSGGYSLKKKMKQLFFYP